VSPEAVQALADFKTFFFRYTETVQKELELSKQAAECGNHDKIKYLSIAEDRLTRINSIEAELMEADSLLDASAPILKPGQYEDLKKNYRTLIAGWKGMKSNALQCLAAGNKDMAKVGLATNYYQQALEIGTFNADPVKSSANKLDILLDISELQRMSGDLKNAFRNAEEALTDHNSSEVLRVLSEISEMKGNRQEAEDYLKAALPLSSKNPINRTTILAELSELQVHKGQAAQADATFAEALNCFAQVPPELRNQGSAKAIGETEVALKRYGAAIRHLSETIACAEQFNYLPAICEARLYRALCYVNTGDQDGATEDLKFAEPYLDELNYCLPIAKEVQKQLNQSNGELITAAPVEQKWALLVGLSKFADNDIPELKFAAKDARDMKDFLITKLGFREDHVRILTDSQATRQNILDSLGDSWLPKLAGTNDLVFLFMASHGTPANKDIGALNYVVAYDTQKSHLFTTGIAMQEISNLLARRVKARRAFMVIDTCYSGAAGSNVSADQRGSTGNVDPERLITANTQLVLCASEKEQRSWESRRYKNGVFSRQLMNVLQDNSNFNDFHEVFPKVVECVSREVFEDDRFKQTPTMAGNWTGKGLCK